MDPSDYVRAIRKFWIVIIVLGLIGGAVGYGIAHTKADSYRSTSTLFVTSGRGASIDQLVQGSTFSQDQVASYVQLATTPSVLTPVIAQLGLSTSATKLAHQITASTPLNTAVVDITVTDSSARQSSEIANAVAASLRSVAGDLAPKSTGGSSLVTLSIVAQAETPSGPAGPNRKLIEIIGLLIGLALGVLFAIFRTLLDTRIVTGRDVELLSDASLLGTVEKHPSAGHTGLALLDITGSAEAEDYRRIATTLQFAGRGGVPVRSLAIVSAGRGDGRTRVALNLALAFAERSQSVLVVDGDLRHTSAAALTRLDGTEGLTDVLAGSTPVASAIQSWKPGVDVLSSGSLPSNPSAVIRSARFEEVLVEIADDYDVILIDTPALDLYSDALPVAELTEASIVVARAKATKRAPLERTLDALSGIRATVLGVVLTQVRSGRPRVEHPSTTVGRPIEKAAATTPADSSEEPAELTTAAVSTADKTD